jgi:hypothetical protein
MRGIKSLKTPTFYDVRTAIANGRLHRFTRLPEKTNGTTTVPSLTRMVA